jgi:hypothetical protein
MKPRIHNDRLLVLALILFLLAFILIVVSLYPAHAEASGRRVTERCRITVVQPGYVAGVCPATYHFFGTRTRATYRLNQTVTVTGYLDYDGEIIYPRITR